MKEVTLESLRDAILSSGLTGPWPVAIWFVDRRPEYVRVLKEASETLSFIVAKAERTGLVVPRIYGVRLFTFNPQGATEAELACRPKFCSTPGVWFEMLDGAHIQLDKEETK